MKAKTSIRGVLDEFFHVPIWLGIILVVIFVLRIPSLFEPYSYGDEMIYITLGQAIRRGLILYKDVHDNKPPLLYFIAAISGSLFWFKAILCFWMMATTILFWKLSRSIFSKNLRFQQVSVASFALLTTLPTLEGNIANAELFMVGFSISGFYLLLRKNLSTWHLIIGGLCFSMAALFKIPAAFELPALFAFWVVTYPYKKELPLDLAKKIIVTSLSFLVPILITFAWYGYKGAFWEYLIAAFGQNVGYLSSWRPDDAQKSFLEKNGPLLVRAFVILAGTLTVFVSRKRLTRGFTLASLWLLFTLFAVTLSERPYPHYLIQSVPAISILIGILISSPRLEQAYTVAPLALFCFVPVYYKFYYYQTSSYYQRFIRFASGNTSLDQYFDNFDWAANRNYEISKFIKSHTTRDEKIFVWGDSPAIYALSDRLPPLKYVASYHINDFSNQEETISKLMDDLPALILILPGASDYPKLSQLLDQKYIIISRIHEAFIYQQKPAVLVRPGQY